MIGVTNESLRTGVTKKSLQRLSSLELRKEISNIRAKIRILNNPTTKCCLKVTNMIILAMSDYGYMEKSYYDPLPVTTELEIIVSNVTRPTFTVHEC